MRWRSVVAGILAAFLTAAAPARAGWFDGGYPKVGKPAPPFTVVLPDGRKLTLDDYKGQVLVLNFWATWCGPCKQELPLLATLYKVKKEFGLRVLAVTTENSLPMYKLAPIQKQLDLPMSGFIRGDYAPINGAVPTNYVIDRAGVVRYAQAGAFDRESVNRVVIPLLGEAAPVSPAPATPAGAAPPALR